MTKEDLRALLYTKGRELIEKSKELEAGSEEHTKLMIDIDKLTRLIIEFEKMDLEQKNKELQRKDENKNRVVKWGIEVLSILVPAYVYTSLYNRTLVLEEKDGEMVTFSLFKNLTSQVKPK